MYLTLEEIVTDRPDPKENVVQPSGINQREQDLPAGAMQDQRFGGARRLSSTLSVMGPAKPAAAAAMASAGWVLLTASSVTLPSGRANWETAA